MPYVDVERTIKTKIIGIASKIDDKDNMKVRQVILEEISQNPEIVDMLYLRKRQVYVMLDNGKEYYLGDIKSKYENLIMNNPTRIKSWQLTGGYPVAREIFEMAGQETVKKRGMRGNYGMNIHIELL
jgi:hypothetical protein